ARALRRAHAAVEPKRILEQELRAVAVIRASAVDRRPVGLLGVQLLDRAILSVAQRLGRVLVDRDLQLLDAGLVALLRGFLGGAAPAAAALAELRFDAGELIGDYRARAGDE